jgi:hypothetical protein
MTAFVKRMASRPRHAGLTNVLSGHSLTRRNPNKTQADRQYPCPKAKRPAIETALRHFSMVCLLAECPDKALEEHAT